MDFKTKIDCYKKRDKDLLNISYQKIFHSVFKSNKSVFSSSFGDYDTKSVINDVVSFYGFEFVNVPVEIQKPQEQVEYVLRVTGIMSRVINLSGEWWIDANGPILCTMKSNKHIYIMLRPKGLSGYEFIHPETKQLCILNRKNCDEFANTALTFYKPFPSKPMEFKHFLEYILSTVTKTELLYVSIISLQVGLAGMILPMISRFILDRVIPAGTINDIFPVAAILVGTTFSINVSILLKDILFTRIKDKVVMATESATQARILNLPASFFKKYSSGEISQLTQSLGKVAKTISGNTISIFLPTIISFVYLFQITAISQKLVFPTIVIIIVMLSFSFFTITLELKHRKMLSNKSAKLSGLVYQLFHGIEKIKTTGSQKRAFSKWADIYSEKSHITYNPNILLTISGAIYSAIGIGSNILIYIIVANSNISPAEYIAFSVAFGAFTYALLQFHNIARQISSIHSNFNLAKPILNETPENESGKQKVSQLSGKIEIANVSFGYDNMGDQLVIDNLSLCIKQGEYVALVGTTGCGKSTLIRILLGFEKPLKGSVYFDDQDIQSLDIQSVRQQIGVVMQNAALFADDILSNITICAPWLTLAEVWEVAEKAGVAEDIRAMPMGMFTMISEGGGGISGGQRQRLIIARAIANNPNIIMFDEATSALDNVTQAIVVDTLNKMKNTRIVIAHRLSTIINCDRIIVLDKGKIVEQGTYSELMANKGLFANMARRQLN